MREQVCKRVRQGFSGQNKDVSKRTENREERTTRKLWKEMWDKGTTGKDNRKKGQYKSRTRKGQIKGNTG